MLDKNWSVGVKITTIKDPTVRSGDCHPWNTFEPLWKKQNGPPMREFLYSRLSSFWVAGQFDTPTNCGLTYERFSRRSKVRLLQTEHPTACPPLTVFPVNTRTLFGICFNSQHPVQTSVRDATIPAMFVIFTRLTGKSQGQVAAWVMLDGFL